MEPRYYLVDLEYIEAKKANPWMGYRKPKLSIDAKLRPLDQFCFSSQYFFLALLGLSANLFVIVGMMVILETATNAYFDIYMVVILAVNQVILLLVEKICLYLKRKLKIWEAPTKKEEKSRFILI